MKRDCSIWELVVWAYAEQSVDRHMDDDQMIFSAPSASGALEGFMALGCRVDAPSFSTRLVSSRLEDDAIILHQAVTNLSSVFYQETDAGLLYWEERALRADGWQIDLEPPNDYILTPRDWFDRKKGGAIVKKSHPTVLVVLSGKAGVPFDWMPNGPARLRSRSGDRQVRFAEEAFQIARSEYVILVRTLEKLRALLVDKLEHHTLNAVIPPLTPWLDHPPPKKDRIFSDFSPLRGRAAPRCG